MEWRILVTLRRQLLALGLCAIAAACSREDTKPHRVRVAAAGCDEIVSDGADAMALLERPQCTDAAIEALERFSRIDPAAMNDLAFAYYVRAQRQDQPVDLLRSLDAADHAVASMPQSAAAKFNRKRALDALHVAPRATASAQWSRNEAQLPAALQSRNAEAVKQLVAGFPMQTMAFLAYKLIPAGRRDDARFLANVLTPITHDHLALDLADDVGKPLEFLARLHRASTPELIDAFDRETRARGYSDLLGPIAARRAWVYQFQGRYLDSLTQDDVAIAEFLRIGARDLAIAQRTRRVGTLRILGQYEAAWRESMEAMREFSAIVNAQDRHTLLGETALTASALGYPKTALLYQNAAVDLFKNELRNAPPEDLEAIAEIQYNIAVALRVRAGIEVRVEQYDLAAADLNEAARLSAKTADPDWRRLVQARVEEVRGQALMRTAPLQAARAFTTAVTLTPAANASYRAELLAQRAEAVTRGGGDAEADLRAAVAALESGDAAKRDAVSAEWWEPYFSRFQDTYRRLVERLYDEKKIGEAFLFAERARSGDAEVSAVQRALPADTAVLEYALFNDRTIVWIVARDRFEAISLDVRRSDVERMTADLSRAVRSQNATALEAQLYLLHRKVMAEPLRRIGVMPARLVVIPDSPMHSIPFGALRNGTTQRYLVQDTTIETAGSAKQYLLSLSRDREIRSDGRQALLIGDPSFDDRLPFAEGLKRLPGARHEVETLAGVYERANVLTGDSATIPAFLASAPKSDVIELAAHALVSRQHSLLLLTPSRSDSGVIDSATKLPHLDKTHLVVLSACSSAGGLPVGPEGIAQLVRPFIAAGVPGVVGTMWNVRDATVEELLVSFHRHYRQGSDAAEALRAAQVELLSRKNPGLRSVLAWAPFQVIGHASSPFASAPHNEKEKPP